MVMRRPNRFVVALAGLLGTLVVSCGSTASSPTAAESLVPFNIGAFTGPYLIWAGIANHDFGSLQVNPSTQASGATALPLMVAGTVDATSDVSQPPVNIAFAKNISVKIVWINGITPNKLLVQPGSGITGPASLKGKKVGLPVGSLEEAYLSDYLATGGLTLNDVQLVNLTPSTLPSAWAAKAIDATYMFEPDADQIQKEGGVLLQTLYAPDWVAVYGPFIAAHRATVQAYVCGYAKTTQAFFNDPSKDWALLGQKFGMTSSEVATLLPTNLNGPVNQYSSSWMGTSSTPSKYAPLLISYGKWLISQNSATTSPTTEQANSLFDPSFAKYVADGKCNG